MDLLACSECGRRFYTLGLGSSESRCCSHCGGGLSLTLHGITSIPLDARWLNARAAPVAAPAVIAMAEWDRVRLRELA
jgi:hypothetical protein